MNFKTLFILCLDYWTELKWMGRRNLKKMFNTELSLYWNELYVLLIAGILLKKHLREWFQVDLKNNKVFYTIVIVVRTPKLQELQNNSPWTKSYSDCYSQLFVILSLNYYYGFGHIQCKCSQGEVWQTICIRQVMMLEVCFTASTIVQ